jgi:cytochrome c oxidase assembly factor CtaG
MVAPLVIAPVLAFAAAAYLRGWFRLRSTFFKGIPVWRGASFFLGLICVWVAAASPVASLDGNMLTAHMAQHLLLMTLAPPLIWLGSPVPPLLYSLPSGILRRLRPWTRSLGRTLGHPAFCWFSAAAVLVAWHVPALFRLGMESETWHAIEHASFLATGLLFWWPVIQPWPSAPRWPRWSMLLYLFLATLPCDVLAGLLVFSDRVAYPVYLCTPRQSGLSALEDQQCAGALMWTCVTVVFLVAGTILSTQLLSPQASREEPA